MKRDCKEVSRGQPNRVALYLLQQPGIDLSSRSSAAFQKAIAQGQLEVFEAMLARKVSLNSQGWRCSGTVQAAAYNGSAELVSRLLNLGANANIQGGDFSTALQAAASLWPYRDPGRFARARSECQHERRSVPLRFDGGKEGQGEVGNQGADYAVAEAVGR